MSLVGVLTDSCASIPEALIEKYNIKVVPYYIHRGMETLRDLVDVQREEFFRWLPTAVKLPTTASPGPGDYLQAFREMAQRTREIVSVHMTSLGSGAYQAAMAAREMARELLPDLRIEVIDSRNVSLCQGWMVIEAARAALEGVSFEGVIDCVRQLIPKTHMIQTADTLRYLYMGGRIGRAKHLVGSLLNIKPLIGMEDGVIVPLGTARSRPRAYQRIAEMMEEAVGHLGQVKVAFVHAAASQEIEKLRHIVEERLNCVETLVAELSPALGVHTGPGTVGVCYYPV
ncbi:MAG: DegV family protein [Anaerolineae bacterium]|jgi:DegV family protein with EDD domain|nr:DegV family protein [Anaerolineae bacterium]MDH7472616.1 DegV family protein [Anaerolineae bacterium]